MNHFQFSRSSIKIKPGHDKKLEQKVISTDSIVLSEFYSVFMNRIYKFIMVLWAQWLINVDVLSFGFTYILHLEQYWYPSSSGNVND